MTELMLHISTQELCQHQGLSQHLIIEVVEHGIAQPVEGHAVADWVFETSSVRWLKKAVRLHYDLELDWIAIATVIELLQENESLQKQNQCLQQQLKRFSDR